MPLQVAAKALSWQSEELAHPPHCPLMHRSGAHSASRVQLLWHKPWDAPTQDCEPPHCSLAVQAQVPLLQIPLAHSESWVHTKGWHEPPHELPEPQSVSPLQALAAHLAPVHVAPFPHSALAPHEAGGVHLAPLQTPSGH
jgi:hypothetical protein